MKIVPNWVYRSSRKTRVNLSAYRYYIYGAGGTIFLLSLLQPIVSYRKLYVNPYLKEKELMDKIEELQEISRIELGK